MDHRLAAVMVPVKFRLATSSLWMSRVMLLTIASASLAFSRMSVICVMSSCVRAAP